MGQRPAPRPVLEAGKRRELPNGIPSSGAGRAQDNAGRLLQGDQVAANQTTPDNLLG